LRKGGKKAQYVSGEGRSSFLPPENVDRAEPPTILNKGGRKKQVGSFQPAVVGGGDLSAASMGLQGISGKHNNG